MRINLENIARVYSGREGCMCGCRGKYSLANRSLIAPANKSHGYEAYTEKSVNPAMVTKVVKILETAPDAQVDNFGVFAVVNGRQYGAYWSV